jgi:hypothetical protein
VAWTAGRDISVNCAGVLAVWGATAAPLIAPDAAGEVDDATASAVVWSDLASVALSDVDVVWVRGWGVTGLVAECLRGVPVASEVGASGVAAGVDVGLATLDRGVRRVPFGEFEEFEEELVDDAVDPFDVGAALGAEPMAGPFEELGDEPDEDEEPALESARASPGALATAVPIPSATVSALMRPMY